MRYVKVKKRDGTHEWKQLREAIPEGSVVVDRARFERMRVAMHMMDLAIRRRYHPYEFKELATNLCNSLHDGDLDPLPEPVHDATTNTASASTIPDGSTPTLTSDRNKTDATSE